METPLPGEHPQRGHGAIPVEDAPATKGAAPVQRGLPVPELLDFYTEHARTLPWRDRPADPWAVLVSEVMLQQTPVVRVLPVYAEWLDRWPRPADLAGASPAAAIRAWGRLGYPRRALRLYEAARTITAEHHGRVPEDLAALRALPGVGEYTARAVAAFAFGARVPVIDTNVRRVLSRIVRGRDSVREPATAADRRELATLLPGEPAVAVRFSVALMEFGALVCTATAPRCPDCPVRDHCAWLRAGSPTAVPRRAVQAWAGTDRQVRGRILAALRAGADALDVDEVRAAAGGAVTQVDRCVASLVRDGLIVAAGDRIALPD